MDTSFINKTRTQELRCEKKTFSDITVDTINSGISYLQEAYDFVNDKLQEKEFSQPYKINYRSIIGAGLIAGSLALLTINQISPKTIDNYLGINNTNYLVQIVNSKIKGLENKLN